MDWTIQLITIITTSVLGNFDICSVVFDIVHSVMFSDNCDLLSIYQ